MQRHTRNRRQCNYCLDDTLTLTATSPLRIKPYSERQGNGRFSVALGYFIQLINVPPKRILWLDTKRIGHGVR